MSHTPNYSALPEQFREEMRAYIDHGVAPSPFVEAVLESHLRDALEMSALHAADEPAAFELIAMIMGWLEGQAPAKCHGSVGAVYRWIEDKGLVGRAERIKADIEFADRYKREQRARVERKNVPAYKRFMAQIGGWFA